MKQNKLVNFLKLIGVYEKFTNQYNRGVSLVSIDSYIKERNKDLFAIRYFQYWDRTQEGFDFWEYIDALWRKYLEKK